jgi:hypothetical protein
MNENSSLCLASTSDYRYQLVFVLIENYPLTWPITSTGGKDFFRLSCSFVFALHETSFPSESIETDPEEDLVQNERMTLTNK